MRFEYINFMELQHVPFQPVWGVDNPHAQRRFYRGDGLYYKIWTAGYFNATRVIKDGRIVRYAFRSPSSGLACIDVGLLSRAVCPGLVDLIWDADGQCRGYVMREAQPLTDTDAVAPDFIRAVCSQSADCGYVWTDFHRGNCMLLDGRPCLIDLDTIPSSVDGMNLDYEKELGCLRPHILPEYRDFIRQLYATSAAQTRSRAVGAIRVPAHEDAHKDVTGSGIPVPGRLSFDSAQQLTAFYENMTRSRAQLDENLTALKHFVFTRMDALLWVRDFTWLLFMPAFMHVELVRGHDHLRRQPTEPPSNLPLEFLPPARLQTALRNAPTVSRVVLGSLDSEPLRHPELPVLIRTCAGHAARVELLTDGRALSGDVMYKILAEETVERIDFLVRRTPDSARPSEIETVFTKAVASAARLNEFKKNRGMTLPMLSFSIESSPKNIQVLPDLTRQAVDLGAARVSLLPLAHGHGAHSGQEIDASWTAAVRDTISLARRCRITLALPPGLRMAATGSVIERDADASEANDAFAYANCDWLPGIRINFDGAIRPCHASSDIDMGNITASPLAENNRFLTVKMKMFVGHVFQFCLDNADNCHFITERAVRMKLRPGVRAGAWY